MSGTILRQWHVLLMLPRPPRRIDTASIEARLRDRGIDVHRRTIQRDLLELAQVFPIVADERARPYGWRWSDDAHPYFEVPAPKHTSGISVSLRIRRTALESVSARLVTSRHAAARGVSVSDDARDPLFAIVAATLDDSALTRRVLLGHGDEVEVVAPLVLRREIADRARRTFAMHVR